MTAAVPVPEEPTDSLNAAAQLYPISKQLHEQRTTGERLAVAIAHHNGSSRFLIIQAISRGSSRA